MKNTEGQTAICKHRLAWWVGNTAIRVGGEGQWGLEAGGGCVWRGEEGGGGLSLHLWAIFPLSAFSHHPKNGDNNFIHLLACFKD